MRFNKRSFLTVARWALAITSVLLVVVYLALVASQANRQVLITESEITLTSSFDNTAKVWKIHKGIELPIIRCDDQKSMIYAVVEDLDGSIGYVVDGEFRRLKLNLFADRQRAPINFSCP